MLCDGGNGRVLCEEVVQFWGLGQESDIWTETYRDESDLGKSERCRSQEYIS